MLSPLVTFEEFLDKSTLLKDINIHFGGLITLNLLAKYEPSRHSLNEYLEIDTDNLGFHKRPDVGTLWYVRCRADTKVDAMRKILDYLATFLEENNISLMHVAISIQLIHLNHKPIDHPMVDPIDYNLIDHLEHKQAAIFKNVIEPIEPYFAVWNGKKWSPST